MNPANRIARSNSTAVHPSSLQAVIFDVDGTLAETERDYIEAALRLTHGNVSQAARLLGINRTTLYNRMESFAKEQ